KPRSEPPKQPGCASDRSSTPSAPRNAPITSPTPDMRQLDLIRLYLPLTSFELRGPEVELGGGGTRPSEVHLYARLIHGETGVAATTKRRTPIVTGPELTRFNPHAVQHWFDQFEAFDPALRLFF